VLSARNVLASLESLAFLPARSVWPSGGSRFARAATIEGANMTRRRLWGGALLLALGGALGGAYWWLHPRAPAGRLLLFGNVEVREVELPFNNAERITRILVEEGDHVKRDQLVAVLDTKRLEPQVAQALAQAEAQARVVERLHAGFRKEEIAQARANVASASADADYARAQYARLKAMSRGAVSLQDFESAKAVLDVDEARVVVQQKQLDLLLAGYREEEIAENEAKLRAYQAQLAFLRQQLADAQLLAPADGVVRARLMEPGEVSAPQRPVLTLAITDPKWVRAYATESNLGKLHPGMRAGVAIDSFPEKRYEGWVGFISPTAEFTPKPVEVEELRTSLVYEVRVFVRDPTDDLRLGMPATVTVELDSSGVGPVTSRSEVSR
jgi:HlyD family secretion protein